MFSHARWSDVPKRCKTRDSSPAAKNLLIRRARCFLSLAISHAICRTKRVFSKLDFLANLPCDDYIVFYRQKKIAGPPETGVQSKAKGRQHKENPRPEPLPGKTLHGELLSGWLAGRMGLPAAFSFRLSKIVVWRHCCFKIAISSRRNAHFCFQRFVLCQWCQTDDSKTSKNQMFFFQFSGNKGGTK